MSTPISSSEPAVVLKDLRVAFGKVQVVDGVDLTVERGQAMALIGESGSGKSVTLRAILRLFPEGRSRIEGRILAAGRDVQALTKRQLADFRGGDVSMIFQEPLLAFDPVYTVGRQITEAILRHETISKDEARKRALALFERVRIPSPERRLDNYPHEMSGGMRQRAMIALALACRPQVLLADEPTTALDATVQIQVLLLLRELQRDLGLSIIIVTHDLGAAVEVADRIAVMYAGKIVETGTAHQVVLDPHHPYTIGLLRSRAEGALAKGSRLETIPGSPPDLANRPPGCPFAPRCFLAEERCRREMPPVAEIAPGHRVACWRTEEASAAYRAGPTPVRAAEPVPA
ncbi:ABC transporter ATP-binding protein [Methylobacterium sp. 092160098-2]|uniref:Oligopeptide/dipeptide ABC transporter, ATPase subunit n=3 Tax=Methylobacteriaceae TaxID=119045 RepID=A0A089NPV4_9HYPH|nr:MULTISPECIES: ABC transporter ATP-binding protein [Methylobacterium]AIQ88580.1 Oligopeptide/dipeptide ABC transporter, ATPase subunit [Methylobacterium oryzae CBMB20]MDE4915866.1 ABC transporter ATP-binding protein [Methylobacterium sp. 092160098-2]MDH3029300.1 ABC transporter ATP-binding protein [Methylobacterium fujisawaense]RUP12232.1 MAG: ABC transporter ATP-binding protein [Methylobacterium sp.]WFS08602.1 ABC transporter ATP-binding protein [Methylobacterium sp. 391_Methyba4]